MCALSIAQRGQRDAHTSVEHGRGRGIVRGYIRASARCDVECHSELGRFQYRRQLDAAHGADRHGIFRGVEYNRNNIPPFITTSIGTLQFNPGAPAYTFSTFPAFFTSISITGTGIANGSSNAPTFIVNNQANIFFAIRAAPATPS
jgi:hypothetical protein